MIKPIELEASNILGIRMEGKLKENELTRVVEKMLQETKTPAHFNMYIEMKEIEGINLKDTFKAIVKELDNIRDLSSKLDKAAIVSDQKIVRNLAKLENMLYPHIEERAFSFEEREEARQWVS